jgi:hypothetical protein
MTTVLACMTCFLMGICVGIRAEYRNGYLDRHLRKPWARVPDPPLISHEDFIDDCEQFNRAMIQTPVDQRVFEAPETLQ